MRRRRPLVLTSAIAVAALALPAAGCGGSKGSHVAQVGSSTTQSSSPSGASSTTAATTAAAGALAFARCMRSHGLPNWPDPNSSGEFDKSKLRQLGYSYSRVRSVQDGPCNHLLNSGASQGYTITPADRDDYLTAAACMRSHGFPDFPDPTFQDNDVRLSIPSSIDANSSKFKSAAATCRKLIPAGLPYSSSDGS